MRVKRGLNGHRVEGDAARAIREPPKVTSSATLELPPTRWFDPSTLPEAARRELNAHLKSLGLPSGPDPVGALARAELDRAQTIDPRVSAADMARAVQRATLAQSPLKFAPIPQRNLFGLTALEDAKFELTAKVLSHLAEEAITPPSDIGDLRVAIKTGPGDGSIAWQRPHNRIEVVASLVRQLVLGKGASLQIVLSEDLQHWLRGNPPQDDGALARAHASLGTAIGGAGGFCVNLVSVLPNTQANYLASQSIHPRMTPHFSNQAGMVNEEGKRVGVDEVTTEAGEFRVNFSAEYTKGTKLDLLGGDQLIIDGKKRKLTVSGTSRVTLASSSQTPPDFGELSHEVLRRIAAEHDTFYFSGPHHFTNASPEECRRISERFAEGLAEMKSANPNLVRHFEYASPKLPKHEPILLEALRGKLDSIGLNSVEMAGMLYRLNEAGLCEWKGEEKPEKEEAEEPAFMLETLLALKKALGIGRVHVHGFEGDLLVLDECHDPERQVLALMRGRQLASMRAANASGEIRSAEDIWPIAPVVKGSGLAALHRFADEMAKRFGLDEAGRQGVVDRWWFRSDDGQYFFFVPSRDIHDKTGGLVSTGDTIDVGALVYGLEKSGATKPLVHASQFL